MSKTTKKTTTKKQSKSKTKPAPVARACKADSKHGQILDLLRRGQGASLSELTKASGWQPHSVRGFLSGTVRKRLGLKLQSSKSDDGERRYTIAG